jgi:hypothetical protein
MTVPTDFAQAAALLVAATGPTEVFGADPDRGARTYRELAKLVHPDRVPAGRQAAAAAAFARLAALWAAYRGARVTLTGRRHSYSIGPVAFRGDIATLYAATVGDPGTPAPDLLVKVTRDPGHGDLVAAEARALSRLASAAEPRHRPYLPTLVESFTYEEPGRHIRRATNVIARAQGFVSLAEVRAAYPDGVDARDAAWMWRRLLVALGVAHRADLVHGAVLPEHVLIHPAEHGLMLVDWCYAADVDASVPAIVPRYADWYPREATTGTRCGPGTDIALAARLMTWLVGPRLPAPLVRFARGCTLGGLAARPHDAWAVLADLDDLLTRVYGPRTFRPFAWPARPGGGRDPR